MQGNPYYEPDITQYPTNYEYYGEESTIPWLKEQGKTAAKYLYSSRYPIHALVGISPMLYATSEVYKQSVEKQKQIEDAKEKARVEKLKKRIAKDKLLLEKEEAENLTRMVNEQNYRREQETLGVREIAKKREMQQREEYRKKKAEETQKYRDEKLKQLIPSQRPIYAPIPGAQPRMSPGMSDILEDIIEPRERVERREPNVDLSGGIKRREIPQTRKPRSSREPQRQQALVAPTGEPIPTPVTTVRTKEKHKIPVFDVAIDLSKKIPMVSSEHITKQSEMELLGDHIVKNIEAVGMKKFIASAIQMPEYISNKRFTNLIDAIESKEGMEQYIKEGHYIPTAFRRMIPEPVQAKLASADSLYTVKVKMTPEESAELNRLEPGEKARKEEELIIQKITLKQQKAKLKPSQFDKQIRAERKAREEEEKRERTKRREEEQERKAAERERQERIRQEAANLTVDEVLQIAANLEEPELKMEKKKKKKR